jgi:hypothetical protein
MEAGEIHPRQLVERYNRGENITSLLRQASLSASNTEEIIETAYDLQSGKYIADLAANAGLRATMQAYSEAIAAEILDLTEPSSLLEPGIGEGTTFSTVLGALNLPNLLAHGFDISWSRVACCREYLAGRKIASPYLSVASLYHLPYADASFDVVYTSHAIEPNGGKELAILTELGRVASRYLVLVEPGYELANDEGRERMERLGYCRGLRQTAESLGLTVVKHELFAHTVGAENPSTLLILKKDASAPPAHPQLACPRYGDPLVDYPDALYSPESLRAYPKLGGIPCLRRDDGVIASAYARFAGR